MDPKEAQQKEIMDQSTRIETMSTQHVKPIPVEQTSDLDATEVFLCENNFSIDHIEALLADKARQRCLVRKVDLKVLTLLAVTYVLQYVDKQAMPYAAVFDLFTSTSVTQTQYSWFASVFYLAYLIAEYPWMYLAQGTCMAKVVSGCVISWGAVLMLTALGKDFAGLAACRFFLG